MGEEVRGMRFLALKIKERHKPRNEDSLENLEKRGIDVFQLSPEGIEPC